MKAIFRMWAFFAFTCILMFISSCSEEDAFSSEEQTELNAEQKANEQANKSSRFWDVVGQLVSDFDYTTDYYDKTFEPIIGVEDPSDPNTRIVSTNTSDLAADRFASLVNNRNIDENTATYTFEDEEVGKLIYNQVNDGSSWATVDISIKQVPHLTKIIYRSVGQGSTQGCFKGIAYYRFGDIVSRVREDGEREYWVCVRPSFGLEGKGDSYWVTMSPLPAKNIWSYVGSNNVNYQLPTGLGIHEEHMQNLAEMLFAICYPSKWCENISNYSEVNKYGNPTGLPIFHDFNKNNIKYHNRYFWQRVQDVWKDNNYSGLLFGCKLDGIADMLTSKGLYLLYKGYSWNTCIDNGPTLYQAHFSNGNNTGSNMHVKVLSRPHKDVIFKESPEKDLEFDIAQLLTEGYPGVVYKDFFGDDTPRYVVRFATGRELAGGTYDPQQQLSNCKDEYRYNSSNGIEYLLTNEPTITQKPAAPLDNPKVGSLLGANGMFYASSSDAYSANTIPVAIVVYVGEEGSVESGYDYKGMAMALRELKGYVWQQDYMRGQTCPVGMLKSSASDGEYRDTKNGISVTGTQADGCGTSLHYHPAAEACRNFSDVAADIRATNHLSNWFIPSVGQWLLAMEGMGFSWSMTGNTQEFSNTLDQLNEKLENYGFPEAVFTSDLNSNYVYATSTQNDVSGANNGYTTSFVLEGKSGGNASNVMRFNCNQSKKEASVIRPFIAF